MVIDYQRAALPEITACNRLHYYGNRLPVVILARKTKTKGFLGEKKFWVTIKIFYYFFMKNIFENTLWIILNHVIHISYHAKTLKHKDNQFYQKQSKHKYEEYWFYLNIWMNILCK